jgi:hypothetical protein
MKNKIYMRENRIVKKKSKKKKEKYRENKPISSKPESLQYLMWCHMIDVHPEEDLKSWGYSLKELTQMIKKFRDHHKEEINIEKSSKSAFKMIKFNYFNK